MSNLIILSLLASANPCHDLALDDCLATPHGVVVGYGEETPTMAADLEGTANRMAAMMGDIDRPIALMEESAETEEITARLADAGYDMVAIKSFAANRDATLSSVEAQLSQQFAGQPQAVLDRVKQQVISQLGLDDSSQHSDFVRHELAHQWFNQYFGTTNADFEYGSDAPDWLDETIAVHVESDAGRVRREQHQAMVLQASGGSASLPLREYLSMDHPMTETLAVEHAQEGDPAEVKKFESKAVVSTGSHSSALYYTISARFSDYLVDKSEDDSIFLTIASALKGGTDFTTWLAGNSQGLPKTIDALQRDFDTWVAGRSAAASDLT